MTSTTAYASGFFRNCDNLNLEYRLYQPAVQKYPTPVLCLHGLTRNLRDFEDFAPWLAELGYRVFTVSQRGRGGSDYDPDPARYIPATYTGDMLDFLDEMKIERATFVGSSMGGIMSMQAAHRAGNRVAAVILNDIGPVLAPEGIARIMGYVGGGNSMVSWDEAAQACRRINGEAFPKETDSEFWITFARRICRELDNGTIIFDYDANIASSTQNEHAAIPAYWPEFHALEHIPTLSVRGKLSDLLDRETAWEMQLLNLDMDAIEVPDIGHVPFLTEPAAQAGISRFLQNLPYTDARHQRGENI